MNDRRRGKEGGLRRLVAKKSRPLVAKNTTARGEMVKAGFRVSVGDVSCPHAVGRDFSNNRRGDAMSLVPLMSEEGMLARKRPIDGLSFL